MEYIDFNIVQTGKTLSSDKIIINKYDNKISRLFFNFDGTILGRLYFAMLNPITNKYCMKPILNSQVIITTEVSVYPGKWSALLVGVQDDYEIIDNNIDQSKVTFVSNPFNRIIVRDNFLSDSSIEPTVNPAIDEALESLRISQDRLENAAIKATESALLSSENAEKTAQDKVKIEAMVKSVQGIDEQVKLVETYKNDASSSAQQASTALSSVNKQSEQVANMKQSIDSTYGQVANLATKVSEDANTVSGMKSSVETLKNETQNFCKLAEDARAVAELASTQASKDKTTIGEWKISIDEIKNQIVIDKAEMDKIKADVNTNKVSSENAVKQTTEDKNAVHLDRIAVETVEQNVEKLGQAVQEATQSGVQMVNQAKQTAVSEITKTGNTHKTDVETAGTTAVQNIGTSKTDALQALETAKADCTSAINSEGKKQTQTITTEGQKHLTTIQQTAQEIVADVNNAGQMQTERVQSAGNTAVESIKTAQGTATQAVETAKTEAINVLQTEGTTQTGNVTTEGTKQVQAVQAAAQEIVADREQIAQNKADVTALKEDLGNIVDDVNPLTWNDGFMLQDGKAVANDNRSVSDFCLCPAESQVEYVSETANQYVQGIVFYDKYKTPIIGYANNGRDGEPCIVTSPKDAYYLRLSIVKSNADKAYFKSSVPTVKSFIERNSHSLITAQDTDFIEIEVTNYMLICDIIKNKAYVVNNNTYAGLRDSENKDSSTLCILDKTKDMYAGNRYNVDVIFFDSDRKFISSTNALYFGTKLVKEQYPSNAKYVAFTWSAKGDGVIADKMYISTVDNGFQTGLPALKYGKTIKYKGQRPIINIYNSDTQEEIFDKLADACYTQDCDVYFENGTYIFDTIYDKIKTYYNGVGDAFEMLLGGNCRYYMYGCIFKGDFTNSTVKSSTFGSHRHAGSYELFGGTIICIDGTYCIHDEVSDEEPLSIRKYHDVMFNYIKGNTYSNWICKCLGCGTGKNTITVIDGCYFESDNDLCVAEASWHGNLNDNSACETFIEVKNSYFKDKGFYVDAIPSGSKQIGKIIFCNNSVKNKLPTESNGWILAGWNNEVRDAN